MAVFNTESSNFLGHKHHLANPIKIAPRAGHNITKTNSHDEIISHVCHEFLDKDSMRIELLAMIKSLNNPKYEAFAEYLKGARIARGLSVRDFAEQLGEDFQVISKIENGERKLSVQEYVQYCAALELDLMDGLNLLK